MDIGETIMIGTREMGAGRFGPLVRLGVHIMRMSDRTPCCAYKSAGEEQSNPPHSAQTRT